MSHPLVRCLRDSLQERANPGIAAGQNAYMKGVQPFHGVKTPERRKLLKSCLARHAAAGFAEYLDIVEDLWNGRYREERYLALDIAAKLNRFRTVDALPLFENMLARADWWDVLDPLAADLLGTLLMEDGQTLAHKVRAWRDSPNLWTRRAALLVQLKHKRNTNPALMAETVLALAEEENFFIRKAIGWLLREYSKTEPDWVRRFVEKHADALSSLSRREALRLVK